MDREPGDKVGQSDGPEPGWFFHLYVREDCTGQGSGDHHPRQDQVAPEKCTAQDERAEQGEGEVVPGDHANTM